MSKRTERDWKKIQTCHDSGLSLKDLCEKFGLCRRSIDKAVIDGVFSKREYKHRCTEEMKMVISEKKKLWLRENPDKHPWRRKDKFNSVPCSVLKGILVREGLSFLEEYIPLYDRAYSLDIAFPDKKIAVEVNGNQHYDQDGKLKPYYQERHDNIEKAGWKVIELHYSTVYNDCLIMKLVEDLKGVHNLGASDYAFYQNEQNRIRTEKIEMLQTKLNCKKCGASRKFETEHGLCLKCYSETMRRVEWPSKEQLESDFASMPCVEIGEKYGVSDVAVKKWGKQYGIVLGNRRGFWQKKRSQEKQVGSSLV